MPATRPPERPGKTPRPWPVRWALLFALALSLLLWALIWLGFQALFAGLAAGRAEAAPDPLALIRRVNVDVNASRVWGSPEPADPEDGVYDCENFAGDKRARLIAAGFAPSTLTVTLVDIPVRIRGAGRRAQVVYDLHAVLVVSLAGRRWVLNNARTGKGISADIVWPIEALERAGWAFRDPGVGLTPGAAP